MNSLLNLDRNLRFSTSTASSPQVGTPQTVMATPEIPQTVSPQADSGTPSEPGEFEIVLGRRQIASISLVMIVLVAIFSAFAYLIGRSLTPKAVAAPRVQSPAVPAPVQASAPPPVQASPTVTTTAAITAPLFHEEVAGKVYIQVAAVPRGFAGLWAEGLRTHGFDAFVAQGPNDVSWRVVIGPLPDPQSFERTKKALDALNLDTFGRRHETESPQ